jgi:hypothetical protein
MRSWLFQCGEIDECAAIGVADGFELQVIYTRKADELNEVSSFRASLFLL